MYVPQIRPVLLIHKILNSQKFLVLQYIHKINIWIANLGLLITRYARFITHTIIAHNWLTSLLKVRVYTTHTRYCRSKFTIVFLFKIKFAIWFYGFMVLTDAAVYRNYGNKYCLTQQIIYLSHYG